MAPSANLTRSSTEKKDGASNDDDDVNASDDANGPMHPLPPLDGTDDMVSADDIDIKVTIQEVAETVVREWQQASVNELEQIE